MSEKLNELKKATMASYLAKAGSSIRTGTKLGLDFEGEKYKHMAVANKHHPNMVTPGFEKDPEKLKSATAKMNAAADLEKTFKRDAANRIKGIARAGRLLAKEEVEPVNEADKKDTMALARHWRDHLSHIGVADYYKHEGERKGRDPKPYERKAASIEKKVAAKWGKSASKDMIAHNWHIVNNDGIARSDVRGPIELRKKHGVAKHWAGNHEGPLTEGIEEINEVSRSTIAKVAQARYNQAQKALKDKNYHEYTVKMKKAIKASDATTPKTGWSHEEETQLPEAEPIVEVSAQEKYRQIRESLVLRKTKPKTKLLCATCGFGHVGTKHKPDPYDDEYCADCGDPVTKHGIIVSRNSKKASRSNK